MRVSELIGKLVEVKDEHGDLVVTQHQWNDTGCPHRVQGIEVVEVKPSYYRGNVPETFVLVKRLRKGGHGGGSMFCGKYQREIEQRKTVKVLHIYYDRA